MIKIQEFPMAFKVNFIKTIIAGLICLSFSCTSSAQDYCNEAKYYRLLNNSYQCHWTFYKLKDTISGTVIKHERKVEPCGAWITATLTIIKSGYDTIRVIDMCSENNFYRGQKVRIAPEEEPAYQIYIPFYFDVIDEGTNQHVARTNMYDDKVMRTTWGEIIP